MEQVVKQETMTPVQAARHGAREEGRKAKALLAGVCGLEKSEQVARLEAAKAAYGAAIAVLDAALGILGDRDEAQYQAGKHQGLAGWTAHMAAHGFDAAAMLAAVGFEGDAHEAPADLVTEVAYQLHKTLPAH